MFCSLSQNRTWGGSWSSCPFGAGAEPTLLRFWAEPSLCRRQWSLSGLMCQSSCLWAETGLEFICGIFGGCGCLEKELDEAMSLSSVQELSSSAGGFPAMLGVP